MSRFLIATMPVPGHIAPMAAVVRQLVTCGHDVIWYGSTFFRSKIEATGARFVPITSALDYGDSDYNKYFPERTKTKGFTQLKFDFKHLFIDSIAGQVQNLQAILRDFPADVLLTDPAVVAGIILSEQGGLPSAILSISVLGLPGRDVAPFGIGLFPSSSTLGRLRNHALYWIAEHVLFRDVQQYYDHLAVQHGWPRMPFRPTASPFLYLQPTVPAFEYPRSDLLPQIHFIGPVLSDTLVDFTPPLWWDDVTSATKPVILVTQGTIATDAAQMIVPTLQDLADEDMLVVATTGGKSAQELGLTVPDNARVTPFILLSPGVPRIGHRVQAFQEIARLWLVHRLPPLRLVTTKV